MEPLRSIFTAYKLEDLDKNWIEQVWQSDFTNFENVPIEYLMLFESLDMEDLLKNTCVIIKDWISKNSSKDEAASSDLCPKHQEVSWQTLLAMNVDVRALLTVLTYYMRKGQAFDAGQDSRQSCLRATSLYFVLLAVPGSNTFQAFHPIVYEIALKTLSLSGRLSTPNKNSSRQQRFEAEYYEDDNENEEEPTESTLSRDQSTTLIRGLNGVMYDLVVLLASSNCSLDARMLEHTVYNLVELTKLAEETVSNFQQSVRISEASISSLSYNAYVALRALCNHKYTSVELIIKIIGKYLLPQLLISNSQLPPRQMTIIRDSTIHFFKMLLQQYEQLAQSLLRILIQHLMLNSPDRSEGRQKQAIVVIKLINLSSSSNDASTQSFTDLVRLSNLNKISSRIFAQEIIGKFLLDLSSTQFHRIEDDSVWPASRRKKILLASALGRCDDVSSIVKGRAIATFAEYTDSIDDSIVRDLFQSNRKNSGEKMPSLENLEEAISNDETDFYLPALNGIIEILRQRGGDERALVRKSALQALRNGVLINEDLLEEATTMIKSHCRDPTLTVRRFAVRVLTTLLEKFPDKDDLCKDWVNFVLPRVFDSEAKVQAEVLDSLEELTIAKIENTKNIEENTKTDLPWKILKEIARNKMGEHLTRACKIWIECGTITEAKISNIKSHITTKNDVEVWLLLASISENKMLRKMENFYNYYELAWKNSSNEEEFLATFCLKVLRRCWSCFDDDSLRRIQRDLTENLRNYTIGVGHINHCVGILYGIIKHFAISSDNDANTMEDLVRLSEATISRIIEYGEESESQNSVNLLLRAMSTMGHSSFHSSEKISTASLRNLQIFLLERTSLPETIRMQKELQGAAIIVLGQLALRDRDIAQEMAPIFGRLLRNTTGDSLESQNENIASGPEVRINAAKALADICGRFASLVEPYLPDMCVSMKDSDPKVRQVILVIFIQLLVENFIQINGAFFFYILTMLADSDETIRQMTMFLIKERLMTKNKSLITQQLVQSVFHFNDYERNIVGSRKNNRERRALTISGEKNSDKRRMIYDFMLEHLDTPGKLAVITTLTKQVFKRSNSLGTRVEQLNFNCEKGRCVLQDAIYIASSDHLQPNSCNMQMNDDDNLEEGTQSMTAVNSAIIEAMKKHRLEVFLPCLVELKQSLAKKKSPVLRDFTRFIGKIIGDYNKDQLAAFYNEYPKFEAELERDSRLSEKGSSDDEDELAAIQSQDGSNGIENGEGSTMMKNPTSERNSVLINPDRSPRIVLRRLSTLTYPGISGWQTKTTPDSSPESATKTLKRVESPAKKSHAKAPKSPRRSRSSSKSRELKKSREKNSRGRVEDAMEIGDTESIEADKVSPATRKAMDSNLLVTNDNRLPKIVLERLSTLATPKNVKIDEDSKPDIPTVKLSKRTRSQTEVSEISKKLGRRLAEAKTIHEKKNSRVKKDEKNSDQSMKFDASSSVETRKLVSTEENLALINHNRIPRIVLRRLTNQECSRISVSESFLKKVESTPLRKKLKALRPSDQRSQKYLIEEEL